MTNQTLKFNFVRSFEEEQSYRKDSPTCSSEDIQTMHTLCTWRRWSVNSIDVKVTFFQGKDMEHSFFETT